MTESGILSASIFCHIPFTLVFSLQLSQYFEEEFIEKHADTIRNLAGHTSDLKSLLKASDASLSVFLFDEYLHKKLSA